MAKLSLDDEEAEYKNAVIQVIQAAMRAGYRDLNDILRQCEGADPVLVAELLKSKPLRLDRPLFQFTPPRRAAVSTRRFRMSSAGITSVIAIESSGPLVCVG
jgi:hypothetical protein